MPDQHEAFLRSPATRQELLDAVIELHQLAGALSLQAADTEEYREIARREFTNICERLERRMEILLNGGQEGPRMALAQSRRSRKG